MSEYTTIWEAVRFGTLKDVIEIFKKGDEKIGDASGDSILFHALANNDSTARYEIANFLINKGADIKSRTKEGTTLFFPLFQSGGNDIAGTTELCRIFLEKRADITALYKPYRIVVFKNIFNYFTDENKMIPLYKLIFSQPGLQLLTKDKWGLTALEFVKRCQKPIALKMMEDYIKKYNLKENS